MIAALVIGFVLSFLGSIPIAGPIAVIIVSKALEHRNRAAFFISIGASVAEAFYAYLAFWGFSTVLGSFPGLIPASRLVGAGILVALGVYLVLRKSKTPEQAKARDQSNAVGVRNILLGFSMTIVNPTLIVTWTAAVGAAHSTGLLRMFQRDAWTFSLGVLAGINSWFAILLVLLGRFKKKVTPDTLDKVIRGIGVALLVLGSIFAVRTVWRWSS
ncbi:MAG: LysE family translocator [Polyangiaceae bacterium]